MSKDFKVIQHMADMLKQGATLTELACPACSSPLFRLKTGQLWCGKCKKRVVRLKEGETEANTKGQLVNLENTVLKKIQAIEMKMREEDDSEKLEKLTSTLDSLLGTLEKLKKLKS